MIGFRVEEVLRLQLTPVQGAKVHLPNIAHACTVGIRLHALLIVDCQLVKRAHLAQLKVPPSIEIGLSRLGQLLDLQH
jgi:hypothetical protein